jgi:hypothetical protein
MEVVDMVRGFVLTAEYIEYASIVSPVLGFV